QEMPAKFLYFSIGIGQINGLWCMFIANDATVKGGTAYPITVKKQAQGNLHLLPWRSLLSLNGALMVVQLLYRQSEIFPERNHGGRTFYNEAVMSVAVVCGSCTVVGAYVPTMSEEAVIVHRIGTIFLGGPPLHSEYALHAKNHPEQLSNHPEHISRGVLNWQTSVMFSCFFTMVTLKADLIFSHQIGIVANNGELTHEASLKGSHFVQLCDQRDIPLIFLQNTAPEPAHTISQAKGSMMSAVACASVPKITVVIGGCHGGDSYAMCGRAFDPNFLFLWPNARVSILAPGHSDAFVLKTEEEITQINEMLEEESSAFFSTGRLWGDGVIRPQDTRKVKELANYYYFFYSTRFFTGRP
uniref:Si:ch211-198n5.11 n=1 Tax=Sinocyclocheilus rhinocerous TaxID=307959 RepID=A0A673MPY7_9TELE